ncbi:MAG: TetR family transcriptional regulator [Nevskia sp.]|nr:TetR family transcriptional regulator [Nevskia sp.]
MRYDPEHKGRTRRSILSEAATAIRTKGPERIGVAEIMASSGLTHGGFYAHFKSKDDLVAQAITQMFDETFARFLSRTEGLTPSQAVAKYVDMYLSRSHRDSRGDGCALAALVGDLPRMSELARARFTEGVERLCSGFARLLKKLGAKNPDVLAYSVLAEMSGTLTLARAINDTQRSDQLLRSAREMVKARLPLAEST